MIDCNILRPHGLSRDVKVLAFCPDDQIEDVKDKVSLDAFHLRLQEMLAAGADFAGSRQQSGEKFTSGWPCDCHAKGISEPIRRINQGMCLV